MRGVTVSCQCEDWRPLDGLNKIAMRADFRFNRTTLPLVGCLEELGVEAGGFRRRPCTRDTVVNVTTW